MKDHPRCRQEAKQCVLQAWVERRKLGDLVELVELKLEGDTLVLRHLKKEIEEALELAGGYVVTTE
jgi:hypothetical protein